MSLLTPLARARGLGSSRSGFQHWWRQRVSAIALVIPSVWLALSVARLPQTDHAHLVDWVARPWNTVLLLSFIVLGFYHALLGIQVIIEDYSHRQGLRTLGLLVSQLAMGFAALVAGFATLRIAFAG